VVYPLQYCERGTQSMRRRVATRRGKLKKSSQIILSRVALEQQRLSKECNGTRVELQSCALQVHRIGIPSCTRAKILASRRVLLQLLWSSVTCEKRSGGDNCFNDGEVFAVPIELWTIVKDVGVPLCQTTAFARNSGVGACF